MHHGGREPPQDRLCGEGDRAGNDPGNDSGKGPGNDSGKGPGKAPGKADLQGGERGARIGTASPGAD